MHNLLEEYNWVKNLNSQVLIAFLKTTNDIQSKYKKCFQQYNLTEVQFNALVLIANQSEQGIPLVQLSQRMLVSKANITGLIDRLERDGLVYRSNDKNDRRVTKAYLTEEGTKIFNEALEGYRQLTDELFSVLTPEEKSSLILLMEKLSK